MKKPKITVTSISASARAATACWTCDLTKEYIAINGDYRS